VISLGARKFVSARAAQARTPPLNRAPAARQTVSKDSVWAASNKSTVRKSPLLLAQVSPSGNGKLGQSPSLSCAEFDPPLDLRGRQGQAVQLLALPRGVVAIAPNLRKRGGCGAPQTLVHEVNVEENQTGGYAVDVEMVDAGVERETFGVLDNAECEAIPLEWSPASSSTRVYVFVRRSYFRTRQEQNR